MAMRVAVGGIVCAMVALRFASRGRPRRERHPGRGAALAAGFSVGVPTTSTATTSGPPLAIWLTARRMEPHVIRDVVSVIFFALDVVGIAVLFAIGGPDSTAQLDWVVWLSPVVVVGHLVGRQVFLRLPTQYYEPLVPGSAFVAGVLSIVTGLALADRHRRPAATGGEYPPRVMPRRRGDGLLCDDDRMTSRPHQQRIAP